MRYHEIINEGRDALLYHGYSNEKFAAMALSSGQMPATTRQRFWGDGRHLKDDDPDYDTSYWMKGISFTRDIRYAMNWGRIVIGVSQSRLAQKYKIIPYNWGYSIPSGNHHKREREEFVSLDRTPDSYWEKDEKSGEERFGYRDMNRFDKVDKYLPLAPILEEIWMDAEIAAIAPPAKDYSQVPPGRRPIDMYDEKTREYFSIKDLEENGFSIQKIISHPKFKGYYYFEQGRRNNKIKFFPPSTPRNELPRFN